MDGRARRYKSAKGHTFRVALLVETTVAPAREAFRGMAEHIRERGPWSLYCQPHHFTDFPPGWLATWKGDGIIARIHTEKFAAALEQTGLPVVDILGALQHGLFPVVRPDPAALAATAIDHLLEHGFDTIGFVGFRDQHWSAAYQNALITHAAAKRVEDPLCCNVAHPTSPDYDPDDALSLLLGWMKQSLPTPAGIILATAHLGPLVIEAARARGRRVPLDTPLVSLDDDHVFSIISNPPLTSIDAAHYRVGKEAAALLEAMMRGAESQEDLARRPLLVPPNTLIPRASTSAHHSSNAAVAKALTYITTQLTNSLNAPAPIPVSLSVPEIAKAAGVSRSVLGRLFAAHVHKTPQEHVQDRQITLAKFMLHNRPAFSIGDIGSRVGYKEQSAFTQRFHAVVGKTPRQYRTSTLSRNEYWADSVKEHTQSFCKLPS